MQGLLLSQWYKLNCSEPPHLGMQKLVAAYHCLPRGLLHLWTGFYGFLRIVASFPKETRRIYIYSSTYISIQVPLAPPVCMTREAPHNINNTNTQYTRTDTSVELVSPSKGYPNTLAGEVNGRKGYNIIEKYPFIVAATESETERNNTDVEPGSRKIEGSCQLIGVVV